MRSTSKVLITAILAASCAGWMLPPALQAQDDRRNGDRGNRGDDSRGGDSRGGFDRSRGGPSFGGSVDRGGGPSFGGFRGGDSGSGGGSFRGGPPDGGGFRGGPPGGSGPGGSGPGGSGDFYRRMDANGNGTLEPAEVPERMRGFMESRLGVDLSRPISIRQLEQMQGRREGESRDGRGDDRGRGGSASAASTASSVPPVVEGGVPGFGAPTTEELAMVAGFGNGNDIPTTPLEKRYDSRVLERVTEALARYDRNKDGAIDSNEWREWRSSTDARTFDKNGDGRLNREEIAARYASTSSGPSRSSSSSSARPSDSDRRRDDRSRGDGPSSSRGDGPSFGRSDGSRRGDSSSGNPDERMASMAGMIMERLDQNRNGFVDGDELKSMRSDPKAADKNGDGKLSKDELAASIGSRSFGGPPGGGPPGGGPPGGGGFFGGRSGDGSSGGRFFGGPGGGPPSRESFFGSRGGEDSGRGSRGGDDRSGSRDGAGGSRDSRSAGTSRRGSTTAEEKPKSYRLLTAAERLAKQHNDLPDWFGRKDVNGDGQVSMAEFASVWSEGSATEFARADRNEDGTVTAAEAVAGPRTIAEPSSSYAASETDAAPSGSSSAGFSTDSGDKYAKQAKTIFGQLDGNKDRSIEAAEWSAKSWTKTYGDFSALDSNADSKLDEAEVTAALRSRGK